MKFKCFDGHTCGNPVRLVTNNHPELKGERMSEKRIDFVQNHDHIRRGLMFEPRGHDMMSGSFIYPSNDKEVDFGILFIETSGCLPMCGHGTIGTVTLGLEHGIIRPKNEGSLRIEVPAGMIKVNYQMNAGKVDWVKIENVASFLHSEALTITDDHLGELQFDVSYGGNFYAIFDTQPNFKGLEHFSASDLIMHAKRIRAQINTDYPNRFVHPEDASIHGVSHVLWTGAPSEGATARNAVFYGDKAIDRSPCGTGTSARMAQWYSKGWLKIGGQFIHESIINSTFEGEIVAETKVGDYPAIIPSIKGWAKCYGENTITINPDDDPYAFGFQVI